VIGLESSVTEEVAGVSMRVSKQQPKGKALRIGRRSAIPMLLFIVCFVSIFNTCHVHHFSSLQTLDVSAPLATQNKLPRSILPITQAPRLEAVLSRSVHWATTSAFYIPVSPHSLARHIEIPHEGHVLSLLVDSGLEVRAPPQCLFF